MATEVITNPTPPVLQGPSDKEKKYDRQLRLWAASGQQALEDAKLLLVNSGSGTVGVETLKNLVLPGIGSFSIADSANVEEVDLGVNFFLDEESLGKSRAEGCVKLLKELNPDVEGHACHLTKDYTLATLLDTSPKYTLIIFTLPTDRESLALLEEYGNKHKIPLMSIHSAGFYSYFRIHLPGNFPIVDTHPDSTATTDLRLLTPWAELSKFAAEITADLEDQSALDHGHVPYVALLLHYLAQWKDEHGSLPSTYKEKTTFRSLVASGARTNTAEGGEENYDEAVAAVLKTISAPSLSGAVKEVFAYEPTETEASSSFWVIADAIKRFYATHNSLPLPGSVPDMKAQSTVYVQLQNIYKTKARQDAAEVLKSVRSHPNGSNVDAAEVDNFCKNAAFIKLIRGTDLVASDIQTIAKQEFESDENAPMTMMPLSLIPIYLALKATSYIEDGNSISVAGIVESIGEIIPGINLSNRVTEIAAEVARAKGGELHNISALTGGMVAQEVIKIITKQYVPIDNTCIFDGITSRTQIMRT